MLHEVFSFPINRNFMKINAVILVLFALLLQRVMAEDSLPANEQGLDSTKSFTLAVLPDIQF